MQQWLEVQYPATEAKAQDGEIHWGDETALVNTDVRGQSYAPAGKTLVAFAVGGTRQKLSMIATVTHRGKTRWKIIDEAFNAERLIEFLQALIQEAKRQVFLILDNLPVHHSTSSAPRAPPPRYRNWLHRIAATRSRSIAPMASSIASSSASPARVLRV